MSKDDPADPTISKYIQELEHSVAYPMATASISIVNTMVCISL